MGQTYLPILDIVRTAEAAGPDFIKRGHKQLAKDDFDDTSLGIGIGWYAKRLETRGIPHTNLGIAAELPRISGLYLDAAAMAIAQFEICYETLGVLPRGGLSSGNIEIWTPEV